MFDNVQCGGDQVIQYFTLHLKAIKMQGGMLSCFFISRKLHPPSLNTMLADTEHNNGSQTIQQFTYNGYSENVGSLD